MTTKLSNYLKNVCNKLQFGTDKLDANGHIDFEKFALYLYNEGLRPRTVKEILYRIHRFQADINTDTIKHYAQFISRTNKQAKVTRTNYVVYAALKHYLNYIGKSNWISLMKKARQPHSYIRDKSIPKADFSRLTAPIKNSDNTETEIDEQYYTLMNVLYYSGMRISETLFSEVSWIDWEKNPVEIFTPKGVTKSDRQEPIYLPRRIAEILKNHLINKYSVVIWEHFIKESLKPRKHFYIYNFIYNGKTDKEINSIKQQFFNGDKIKPLSLIEEEQQAVIWGLRAIAKEKNMVKWKTKLSPHCFRHSFAHTLEEKGFSATEIKMLLRHSSLAATERYLQVERKKVRNKFMEKMR